MSEVLIQSQFFNESYDFKKVAQQACGSVWYQNGGTVILASVAVDEEHCVNEDFLPLTIQYIEKTYASAKFPSGFIKRESKPSDFETLTSRIIDRTLRPLFPKYYYFPTQISVMVLSYDGLSDLQVCALNAASSALYVSGIPVSYPVNAVRIGKNEQGLFVLSNIQDLQTSQLDLYVSGYHHDILMIEMRSQAQGEKEIPEEELIEAIELAKSVIATQSNLFVQAFQRHQKPSFPLPQEPQNPHKDIVIYIQSNYWQDVIQALNQMAKSERMSELETLAKRVAENTQWELKDILQALRICKKKALREMILQQKRRADGRGLKEIRQIDIQTNLLPCAHGSCLFKRGQTQALVIATIGGENDAQGYELLGDRTLCKERFMVHYNFPPFSVGEASMIGAPGRRELGHGNLVKRALESSVEDMRVVRLVSEILESNGSSSMASVCGGSLALRASGVQISGLVAGIAMGLVKEGDNYAILTDIMGLEDHCGDMDFKVAGNAKGITALQMDIKLGGISSNLLKEAIVQAKEARIEILEKMAKAEQEIIINENIVPRILCFEVPSERIVEIIGSGGKVIREIIEKFGVNIDLDRLKGEVRISGIGKSRLEQTKAYILELLEKAKPVDFLSYAVGLEFMGRIKKIVDFGAFVEMPNGGDGLLHISKIRAKKLNLKESESIECKVLSVEQNKIELDIV